MKICFSFHRYFVLLTVYEMEIFMEENYLLSTVGGTCVKIESTVGLREKWVGAMLDRSGRAYSGAFRLDFSNKCNREKVIDAVVETLSNYPILNASFKIEDDVLVGYIPTKNDMKENVKACLQKKINGISDEKFIDYEAESVYKSGLRIASETDENGIHIWIGFWIFTCDGTSIDIIIDEISKRYQGSDISLKQSWNEYVKDEKAHISQQIMALEDTDKIYKNAGPYGLDAVRQTPYKIKGLMKSMPFVFEVSRDYIGKCAKDYRVTPFALMFAIFQKAISNVSGVKNVITGIPFANRHNIEEYAIVGPISNTIPVLTHHEKADTLESCIKAAQKSLLDASRRQSIETSILYPKGISPRNVEYELPYPQLFNAWNSQHQGDKIQLGEDEWMTLHLLPNNTCRVGFEITLDGNTDYVSGRIDLDLDAYGTRGKDVIFEMNKYFKELLD